MTQEITVTNVGDHYEMQFDGGNAYPVPENAIDKLDDDLTPADGESVTFKGDYGGHKHAKTFTVEEVTDGDGKGESGAENVAEPTPEHVEAAGYNKAAGQAQQVEAQRLFQNDDS